MAVLKNKTDRSNFMIVSKIFLQDTSLSLAERGLLATMHSLPDDWDFTVKGMERILPDGEARIKKALNGLIAKGYVRREQDKTEHGRFGNNLICIHEKPLVEKPPAEKPLTEKPPAEKPLTEKPLSEKPPAEESSADSPPAEKQAQYSNKELNNKEFNNESSINPSDGEGSTEECRKTIAENIKLDWLLDAAGQRNEDEVHMVREVYEVICDMVCYPRKDVEIKGTRYPWSVVRERFLKLEYDHVASVLNRIMDASLNIKNMSAYLISTLYTESMTGTLEIQSGIHDEYLKELRGHPY